METITSSASPWFIPVKRVAKIGVFLVLAIAAAIRILSGVGRGKKTINAVR